VFSHKWLQGYLNVGVAVQPPRQRPLDVPRPARRSREQNRLALLDGLNEFPQRVHHILRFGTGISKPFGVRCVGSCGLPAIRDEVSAHG